MDQYSQEEVSQFKEAFSVLDTDKKGRVSSKDLVMLFERMGESVTEQEIIEILKPHDSEAKNSLDFKQFLGLVKKEIGCTDEEEQIEAFNLFDKNKEGAITTKDIHGVLEKFGEKMSLKDVQDIVDEIGDGERVLFNQFSEMMK